MRRWTVIAVVGAIAALGVGCHDFGALSKGYGHDASVPDDLSVISEDFAGMDLLSPPADFGDEDFGASCANGVLDSHETDVDCGGVCSPCDVGLACIVGGDCQTGVCDRTRCELASGPPSWVQVGTPPVAAGTAPIARNDVTAFHGNDGNLYIAGGIDSGANDVNTVEELQAGTLNFSTAPSLVRNRIQAASASNATSAYVLFGVKDTGTFETSCEKSTNTPLNFSLVNNITDSEQGAGATFGSDGRIYIVGGANGGGDLAAVNAFAPGDNALTTLHALGTPRGNVGVAVGSDGRIYAVGGQNGAATLATVEAYTIANDTWTLVSAMPQPRASTEAVLAPDGRIYMAGGADLGGGTIYNSVVAYRAGAAPRADRWTTVAPLLQSRSRHGVAVGNDGRIYVFSGSNLLGFIRTTEAYGPILVTGVTHAAAGAAFQVSGSNFAARALVHINFATVGGAVIGTGTTDANGNLAAMTVMVPAGTANGATAVFATDARSRYPVSAAFSVP